MDRGSFTRALWQAKLDREITPNAYLIGRALLRRADRRGQCWPSLDTLAADVGCCARTAGSAVASLRLLGLLDWESRRVGRFQRTSNLYTLGQQLKENPRLDSFPARVADHQPSRELSARLRSLADAMEIPVEALPAWLTDGVSGTSPVRPALPG